MVNKIGSSGFEYRHNTSGSKYSRKTSVSILNSNTKKVIATIKSDYWITRSGRESGGSSGSKTFYGLDNRYYHVTITGKTGAVQWGQIQSDGAVIDSKRNVIKYLDFYPLNVTPTTVPTLKPVVKTPAVPVISAIPAVVSVAPVLIKEKTEEISWIKMINKLIMKIKMWMINLLNR